MDTGLKKFCLGDEIMTPIFLNSNLIKLMAECRDAAERIVYRMDKIEIAIRDDRRDAFVHEVMLALFNAHINK